MTRTLVHPYNYPWLQQTRNHTPYPPEPQQYHHNKQRNFQLHPTPHYRCKIHNPHAPSTRPTSLDVDRKRVQQFEAADYLILLYNSKLRLSNLL
jgi:hypothetical protein